MRGTKPKLQAIDGGLSRLPAAPSWLSQEAKAEWRRIIPVLNERRTMTKADLQILESYCLAVGKVRSSEKLIAAEGEMIDSKHGRKRHPAFQTMFQSLAESRRLAAELGLTPASRNKAPIAEGADDLSDLDL